MSFDALSCLSYYEPLMAFHFMLKLANLCIRLQVGDLIGHVYKAGILTIFGDATDSGCDPF